MSIKVMAQVWAHSKMKGSALLLLLAIADHAHDDGGGAYPSTETLSRKIRMSVRQTQRMLRTLEASGELKVHLKAGPHKANLYTVRNIRSVGGDKMTPPVVLGMVTRTTRGGDTAMSRDGDMAMSPKPPVTVPNHQSTGLRPLRYGVAEALERIRNA